MTSLFDFSKHITELKKEEKYVEVLSYFKENKTSFSKEQISNNEYIISDIVYCIRKTNQFDAGFQFLKIYNINIDSEQKERILNAYGWLLYSKYKVENENTSSLEDKTQFFDENEDEFQEENFHYDKNELIEKIKNLIPILLHLQLNSDFSKLLISKIFSIVLKTEKKKPAPNWKLVNDFCNLFDPNTLSKDCSIIQVERKGQIRDMELASDFENWYAYKTNALMKSGKWQECFDTSKKALENIENFHYSNDVWFSLRVALSKKNLGNTDDTIKELEIILKKKREWFIQYKLAELYFEKEKLDDAFKMAINAINNFGPLESKVNLLFLIGKILKKLEQSDLAFKHFSLYKLIRQDEEWKIPQEVFDELNQFSKTEIPHSNITDLKNELKKYWNGFSQNRDKKNDNHESKDSNFKGEVIRILHDNERGKDGFVKCNQSDFYFSLSSEYHLTPKIKIGSEVIFKKVPNNEGKKEKIKIIKIV